MKLNHTRFFCKHHELELHDLDFVGDDIIINIALIGVMLLLPEKSDKGFVLKNGLASHTFYHEALSYRLHSAFSLD